MGAVGLIAAAVFLFLGGVIALKHTDEPHKLRWPFSGACLTIAIVFGGLSIGFGLFLFVVLLLVVCVTPIVLNLRKHHRERSG